MEDKWGAREGYQDGGNIVKLMSKVDDIGGKMYYELDQATQDSGKPEWLQQWGYKMISKAGQNILD